VSRTPTPDTAAQISGLLFAVLLLDPKCNIVEANPAAEDILGQSAGRMIGKRLEDAVRLPADAIERIRWSEERLVARGLELDRSGQTHGVNLTVSPVAAHPGWRVLTLSDAGRDDMRDEADSSVTLKAPAILAHEIKNPLAAIKGASQLLSRKLDDSGRKLSAMIVDEVDRIARLVDRMQELGSSSVEIAGPVNLHQVVRKAIASVATANPQRAVLAEEFDPSLPDVYAAPDALEQILVNLITNAVDAAQVSDRPRVVVRTRFVSGLASSGGHSKQARRLQVELAVCDNGPGLSPEVAGSAFEPFVTSKQNGQGLGLALVKKLTHEMGGRVSYVRNEVREKTEFRIHLALADRTE